MVLTREIKQKQNKCKTMLHFSNIVLFHWCLHVKQNAEAKQ